MRHIKFKCVTSHTGACLWYMVHSWKCVFYGTEICIETRHKTNINDLIRRRISNLVAFLVMVSRCNEKWDADLSSWVVTCRYRAWASNSSIIAHEERSATGPFLMRDHNIIELFDEQGESFVKRSTPVVSGLFNMTRTDFKLQTRSTRTLWMLANLCTRLMIWRTNPLCQRIKIFLFMLFSTTLSLRVLWSTLNLLSRESLELKLLHLWFWSAVKRSTFRTHFWRKCVSQPLLSIGFEPTAYCCVETLQGCIPIEQSSALCTWRGMNAKMGAADACCEQWLEIRKMAVLKFREVFKKGNKNIKMGRFMCMTHRNSSQMRMTVMMMTRIVLTFSSAVVVCSGLPGSKV